MNLATGLASLAFFAAIPAAPPPAAEIAAVNQSTLQTFTKEGFRSLLLRASSMHGTREQVDMTDMILSVFSGDATERIETILLAPTARFFPDQNLARGEKSVRLIRDEMEITGEDWTYDHARQKVTIDKNVRVVFHAELSDILQ